MPNAGDIKWIRNDRLMTKEAISEELGIAVNGANWSTSALQFIAENSAFMNLWFAALIGGTSLAANIFYSTYRDGIQELLDDIEELDPNQEFYVEQKYRWHAGHRSWQPLSEFRVVLI